MGERGVGPLLHCTAADGRAGVRCAALHGRHSAGLQHSERGVSMVNEFALQVQKLRQIPHSALPHPAPPPAGHVREGAALSHRRRRIFPGDSKSISKISPAPAPRAGHVREGAAQRAVPGGGCGGGGGGAGGVSTFYTIYLFVLLRHASCFGGRGRGGGRAALAA